MIKRRYEHRTLAEVELLIAAINREFFDKKGVRIELENGEFMIIREFMDKGINYAITLSNSNTIWRK